jgi:tetratricopeptide (TPR) repeat protein
VATAFAPALKGEFVAWDDFQNFVANRDFRGLGLAQLKWAWTTTLLGHYVPLSWMSLELDYVLWGMNPWGYHATSIAIHAVNAVLVYFVALRLLDGRDQSRGFAATVAALLFAVHPLRTESVAWITERRDVLSLFFVLLATLAYLRHARRDLPWSRWYLATVVAFIAALLSKGSVVTFPAILVLLNWHPLDRLRADNGLRSPATRKVVAEVVPLFVLSAIGSLSSIIALSPGPQLGIVQKLAVSTYSLWFYVAKMAWPTGLAALYPMPGTIPVLSTSFIASYVCTAMAMVVLWQYGQRYRGPLVAVLGFLVLVFPFLGIVQTGAARAADRYTYLAAIPVAILAGAGVSRLRAPSRYAVAAGAIVILLVATRRQSEFWLTSEALWTRVAEVDSTSHVAHNNLGTIYAERGESERAMRSYRKAIDLSPTYPGPYNNMGFELAQAGRYDEAIRMYRKAISLEPDNADAESNLGNALAMQGRLDDAVRHFSRAATLAPHRAGTQFSWGLALYKSGRLREAALRLERAIELDPHMRDAQGLYFEVVRELQNGGL